MQIRTKLFLISVLTLLAFSGCASQNNQTTQFAAKNDAGAEKQAAQVSAEGMDSAEPAIAAGKDGVYVVWVSHTTNKEGDILIRKFDFNGQPRSEQVRVNPQAGQAKAWYGDPPTIKIGPDGAIYVGWTANVEEAKGAANTLYLSVSRDDGHSFGAPVKVNDDTAPASHGMHSLAIDETGRVYVLWLDERYLNSRKAEVREKLDNELHFEKAAFFHHKEPETKADAEPNAELYFAVSTDGGKTFSANKRLAENVCPCCKTSLLATNGRLYASWRQVLTGDFRHIAVASSTDSGSSFSAPTIVSDDKWQINACPVSGAALTASGNTLKVAWYTAGAAGLKGLYLAESADNGKTFAPRILISNTAVSGIPALLGNDKIIWSDNGKIILGSFQEKNKSAENKQEISNAELFSAAGTDGEYAAITYIEKQNEKRAVRLIFAN